MISLTSPSTPWVASLTTARSSKISSWSKAAVLALRRGCWPLGSPYWPIPRRGPWRRSTWSLSTQRPSLVMDGSRLLRRRPPSSVLSRRTGKSRSCSLCLEIYLLQSEIKIKSNSLALILRWEYFSCCCIWWTKMSEMIFMNRRYFWSVSCIQLSWHSLKPLIFRNFTCA